MNTKLESKEIVVHRFGMGDCEDPEIYSSEPIYKWQQTEKGKWIMEHAIHPPTFYIKPDLEYFGYKCTITAELTLQDQTFYYLKWPEKL